MHSRLFRSLSQPIDLPISANTTYNQSSNPVQVTTAPQVIYQPVAVPQYAQPVPQQYMQQQQPGQYPAAGTNPPSYYNPPSNNY